MGIAHEPVRRRRGAIRPFTSLTAASAVAGVLALGLTYVFSASVPYLATVIATGAVYAIAATGLDVVVGWLREVSVGQAAAMLVGAYAGQPLVGFSPLLALLAAIAAGYVTGVVIGLPALRVRGFALATYTLIFALGVQLLFNSLPAFGGAVGKPVVATSFFGLALDPPNLALLCVAAAIVGVVVHARLRASLAGLAWRSVGLNAQAAGSIAVNPVGSRLAAFGLSGAFGGAAGLLYAMISGYVAPDVFDFELAILILAMVVIGGRTHPLGGVIGAAIFTVYREVAPANAYSDALIGAILMIVIWLAPRGVTWYVHGAGRALLSRLTSRPGGQADGMVQEGEA